MPVIYDNKAIIPAPFIRIEKEVSRNGAGGKKQNTFAITLSGSLTAEKGSPNSSGVFWTTGGYPPDETISLDARLATFRAKQGALCALFCEERKWLEVQPYDGSAAIKCQPRLRSQTFGEGIWVNRVDYTFVFEADSVWFGALQCCADGDPELDPVEESWDIEQADDAGRTYRVTHNVAANYRDRFDSDGDIDQYGWELAKTAVTARLGFQQTKLTQSGVLNLSSLSGYNHARVVSENPSEGTYRVTETWLCFDVASGPKAIEDYTITTREQNGRSTVSINGTIQGLHVRDSSFAITETKYAGAAAKWAIVEGLLLTRAQSASGLTLNPSELASEVARNELTGVITYSIEFDNRFTFGDAITLEISLQDQRLADVFAAIPVVGRPAGPILQEIGSSTETSRTVSVSAQFPALTYGGVYSEPDISALFLLYRPSATQVFVGRDESNYEIVGGRYTRSVTYVYQ